MHSYIESLKEPHNEKTKSNIFIIPQLNGNGRELYSSNIK